jgi:hypothetical protein
MMAKAMIEAMISGQMGQPAPWMIANTDRGGVSLGSAPTLSTGGAEGKHKPPGGAYR